MTEKRFDVGNLKIQDNAPKGRVYLLDMQGGVNALCSLINGLNDKSNRLEKENEQLKKELESFKPIIFESDGKPVTLYKKGDVE